MCRVVCAGRSFQVVVHGQLQPTFFLGASLASVYILETGLVQNAPSASLIPALWMLSSWRRPVFDAVLYTMHPWSSLGDPNPTSSVQPLGWGPPLHLVFSALMFFLDREARIPPKPEEFRRLLQTHYGDVIMGAIASQITSLTIVNSTVYSDADQRKHQSFTSLAFVRGIHRGPVNSPHK